MLALITILNLLAALGCLVFSVASRRNADVARAAAERTRRTSDRIAYQLLDADKHRAEVQTEVENHAMHCSSCGLQAAVNSLGPWTGEKELPKL